MHLWNYHSFERVAYLGRRFLFLSSGLPSSTLIWVLCAA